VIIDRLKIFCGGEEGWKKKGEKEKRKEKGKSGGEDMVDLVRV